MLVTEFLFECPAGGQVTLVILPNRQERLRFKVCTLPNDVRVFPTLFGVQYHDARLIRKPEFALEYIRCPLPLVSTHFIPLSR